MAVRLTAQEQDMFLATAHTGLITTLRRDGSPVTLPVWFVALDGAVYVPTPESSAKVRRVRNDDRCWFLVERGRAWSELAAVGFPGRAVVLPVGPERDRAEAALDLKYSGFRPEAGTLPEAVRRHYEGQVLLRVEPTGTGVSWDNRKVRLSQEPPS